MVYASIEVPYDLKKEAPIDKKSALNLKGKLSSALTASKIALTDPMGSLTTLSNYMQTNKGMSKFGGLAIAQTLIKGQLTNQAAAGYLFQGLAPAMDKTALTMGYQSALGMKTALMSGTINVNEFVGSFSSGLKTLTDFANRKKLKDSVEEKNIIEFDATFSHNRQYQSETPDRRVESGQTFNDFIHNMPDVFNLDCGLKQDGKYTPEEFVELLEDLRKRKVTFILYIGKFKPIEVMLQNFNPSNGNGTQNIKYTIEFKKIQVGTIEMVHIDVPSQSATSTKRNTTVKNKINKSVADKSRPNPKPKPKPKRFEGSPSMFKSNATLILKLIRGY